MNTHLDDDQYGIRGIHSATARNRGVKPALLIIAALLVFVTVGLAVSSVHKPASAQREVQATEITVVSNAIGRDQAMSASKGNDLQNGQRLVSLQDQDLQPRLEEARAAMELAKEHNKQVRIACAEYICAQSNWWVAAHAVAEHSEHTVARSRALQAAGVISPQELHDLESGVDWARSCERAAKASLDLAVALFDREGGFAASTNREPLTWRGAELEASVGGNDKLNNPRAPLKP